MTKLSYELKSETATQEFGRLFAKFLQPGLVIGLQGEIGRGKTCLVRACLQALGVKSSIKSPTYTLVETYELAQLEIHHFDLYRLQSPFELEDLGFRDYLHAKTICFIEWPEKAPFLLTMLDLVIELNLKLPGRLITLSAASNRGREILNICQRELCFA